ncbi:hypothetical protein MHLNE_17640 [Moorella humiferrea]|uniref:helix-turn-helix transcriptional regulator n=1 Tax=Neomoorella humiferrea TaxID=676965 RepID=UPI0030D1072C
MRTALRRARLRAGLTQAEVARRVGLTRASYTNIEGGYKDPSIHTALRIAQILNEHVEELFGDRPPCENKRQCRNGC